MANFQSIHSTRTGFGFWLQWVCVTVLGFLISLYWIEIGFKPDIGLMQGAIGGTVVGVAQTIVLRQRLPRSWEWAFATIVGWCFVDLLHVGVMGWVAPRTDATMGRLYYGMLDGVQVGLIVGAAQWLAIRRSLSQAWRWILGTGTAWAVGLSCGWIVGGILRLKTHLFLGEVVGLAFGWMMMGVLSGIVLVNLLNSTELEELEPSRSRPFK
ncbi:MAG: hypothetical protein HC769_07830 [Cyanobacteria bacterium CRU_2_1]|nr:hypothetical protein [Cyanobacteria bacterium RU_5_0]NJR58759.1 hypothetical protein [Cyanobacteria bacterium CRU_2_1]